MKNIQKYLFPGLVLIAGVFIAFWYFNEELPVEAKSTSAALPSSIVLDAADKVKSEDTESQKQNGTFIMYYSKLQSQLKSATDNIQGDIGVTYLDLATGQEISINGSQAFYGASTTKVPLVMLISDNVAAGKLSWDQQVKYDKKDYETGTGTIQGDIKPAYKLSDLAALSITVSDNIAKNMLYSLLGGNEAGIKQIYTTYLNKTSKDGKNEITSDDAASILEQLYHEAPGNTDYQAIINNMQHTVFHQRLETATTTGHVAHKIGSYEDEVHDIGIFYNAHPYVLTVYTNQVKNADEIIAQLSDEVWLFQSNAYPQ